MRDIPGGIAEILNKDMSGVARIVLRHVRHSRFRYMVILEITLAIFLLILLLPLFLIILIFFPSVSSELDFSGIGFRFHHFWHELCLTVYGPQGQPLAEVRHAPINQHEGEAVVSAILETANDQGLVIVEAIASSPTNPDEVAEVWYGGQPLLASLDIRPEAHSASLLKEVGFEIEESQDGIVLKETESYPSALVSALQLLLVGLPLSPVLVFTKRGRQWLVDKVKDIRGTPRAIQKISIKAESITISTCRGQETRERTFIDGADILGITYSPMLGYDKNVTRQPETLRVVGKRSSIALPISGALEARTALRDYLVTTTIRLRAAKPELGLLVPGQAPTRCPYCSHLYMMEPGTRCPNCGAPAGAID